MQAIPVNLARSLVFVAACGPAGYLLWLINGDTLGADPGEALQQFTGIWTLNFLLLTLCISPLRAITGQHWLLRLRRMLGLFTFAYGCLHLFAFVGFNHEFSLAAMARDIVKRPFISVGLAAFALLVPLALTSNAAAVRRLGGRQWQELHRSIYLIAILGCVHLLWQSSFDELPRALAYTCLLGILLWWRVQNRKQRAIPAAPSQKVQAIRFYNKRPD